MTTQLYYYQLEGTNCPITVEMRQCKSSRSLPKVQPPKLIHKDLLAISFTSVLSKCLEQFICAWKTAIAGDQVYPQQYGSVKGTSAVHTLIGLVHRWKSALDCNQMVNIILMPTQIGSENRLCKVEVHYYQLRRLFCASNNL